MKFVLLLISLNFCYTTSFSQAPNTELDFWLGSWNLRWQDNDSTEATGTNRIFRELDGQVLCEYFQADNGKFAGFTGRSWSVYDRRAEVWKQTWVDNQGSYLDFTGGKDGDNFVFQRGSTGPNGQATQQKMVFHSIQDDQFTWDWMRSNDDGKTWQLLWRIYYTRQKE